MTDTRPITTERLIELLGSGGWFYNGGSGDPIEMWLKGPVVHASANDAMLHLTIAAPTPDQKHGLEVIEVLFDDPCWIVVRYAYQKKAGQRAKRDGGGWHTTTVRGMVGFVHPDHLSTYEEQRAQERREEDARRQVQAEEACRIARQEHERRLTGELAGKQIARVRVTEDGGEIVFTDGTSLKPVYFDRMIPTG